VFPRVLFGCFAGTTPLFDSSPACLPGLCFWLPGPVRELVAPGCRRGLAEAPEGDRQVGSRACSFPTCSWLWDYAGPDGSSRYRSHQCCLPVRSTRSAPEMRFSKLNSRPVDASVYASPGTSRHPAQDSRSGWFATPFLWGSFIPDCTRFIPTIALLHGRGTVMRSFYWAARLSKRRHPASVRPQTLLQLPFLGLSAPKSPKHALRISSTAPASRIAPVSRPKALQSTRHAKSLPCN